MRKTLRHLFIALLTGLLFLPVPHVPGAQPKEGKLIVTATGFRDRRGTAIFTLYRRGENWLDMDRAYAEKSVAIATDSLRVTFDNIPHDTYAVNVVHDTNENRKLDMRWFPWPRPKEGAGVSNNHERRGPPQYEKAKFELDRPSLSIRIQMRYY